MDFIKTSWKAIIALVGTFVVTQLPSIEVFVNDWVQGAIGAIFVAVSVWLKANAAPEA